MKLKTSITLSEDIVKTVDRATRKGETLPKSRLTQFIAALAPSRLAEVDRALVAALGIDIAALT